LKALVFLLVLANLFLYALANGLLGRTDNPDAQRVDQQVTPERLRIIGRGEAPPAPATPTAAAGEESPATPTSQAAPGIQGSSADAPPAPSPLPTGAGCLRWEKLAAGDAERLASLIADKFPATRTSRQAVEGEGNGWWVFIPPLASRADAEKKASELRARGVTDYFINLEAGTQRYAISLGVFSTEKGAMERLTELRARNVRSAQVTARPGRTAQVSLEASGPLAEQAALRVATGELLPRQPATDCP